MATIDIQAANELYLFAVNDANLYRQRIIPIIANLRKKVSKGIYNPELALKLWKYAADDAAKRYNKEYAGSSKGYGAFNVGTRLSTARQLQNHYLSEVIKSDYKKNPRKASGIRIVYNKLLGGWYIVRGSHQTPIGGRFNSKAEAQAHLMRKNPRKAKRKAKYTPFKSFRRRTTVKQQIRRKMKKNPAKKVKRFHVEIYQENVWKKQAMFYTKDAAIAYAKAYHRIYPKMSVAVKYY